MTVLVLFVEYFSRQFSLLQLVRSTGNRCSITKNGAIYLNFFLQNPTFGFLPWPSQNLVSRTKRKTEKNQETPNPTKRPTLQSQRISILGGLCPYIYRSSLAELIINISLQLVHIQIYISFAQFQILETPPPISFPNKIVNVSLAKIWWCSQPLTLHLKMQGFGFSRFTHSLLQFYLGCLVSQSILFVQT